MSKRPLNFKLFLNFATIHAEEEKHSYHKYQSHYVHSKWSEWFNIEQNKKRHSTESSPLTFAMWTTQRAVGYSLSVFASSHCVANFRSPSNGEWDTSVKVPPEPETGISIEASWPVMSQWVRRVTVRYTYTKRISISDPLLICGLLIGTTGHGYIERISKGNIYCKADKAALYRLNITISVFFDLWKICFRYTYFFQPLFQCQNNFITVCIKPLNSEVSHPYSVCTSWLLLLSFNPLNHKLLYFTSQKIGYQYRWILPIINL